MEDTEQGMEHRHAPLPDGVIDVETANVLAERLKMLSDPGRLPPGESERELPGYE